MSDYWMSTNSPQIMFRKPYQTPRLDAFLRDHAGIDSALLAIELGINRVFIESYQRHLGLRGFERRP